MSSKALRLVVFFLVCCGLGVVALYFLFSPKYNPHFLESLFFFEKLGAHEKAMVTSDVALFQPQHAAEYGRIVGTMKIAPEDFNVMGLPKPTRDLWITTKDGAKLHGWYFGPEPATKTVLLQPAGSMFMECVLYQFPQSLLKSGAAVVMFDNRGCGESTGKATIDNGFTDAEAEYDYVVNELKVPPQDLAVAGSQYNTFFAKHLASTRKCAALILFRPMDSVKTYNDSTYPPTMLVPESEYPAVLLNFPAGFEKAHVPLLVGTDYPSDCAQLRAQAVQPAKFIKFPHFSVKASQPFMDSQTCNNFGQEVRMMLGAGGS